MMMENFAKEIFSRESQYEFGKLLIAGIPAEVLVREYGTPLYVLDQKDFFFRAESWKRALERHFGPQVGTVYYAAKAFVCVEVAKWIDQLGLGIDVCTGGEMAVVRAANFPVERIQVHGNNKSEKEISDSLAIGAALVIDSFQEIERASRLAHSTGKVADVFLRITPGVEAHTHEFIATAHEDVKFGFSLASGAAWRAIEEVERATSLRLIGLHSHIGSQIFSGDGFTLAIQRVIGLLAQYRDHFDRQIPQLDLGGGFGIAYLPGEFSVDPDQILASMAEVVKNECATHSLNIPTISIEPGRAVVGPTTTTLYTVGTTKDVALDNGVTRRYVAVDGGMSDNIRPALYGAEYHALLANRVSTASPISTRIVGKHCESGDIIIRDIDLPSDIGPGDILAIPATGAYGRSMASNYNHLPRPAVITVIDGGARTILRRESEKDLLALDVSENVRKLK